MSRSIGAFVFAVAGVSAAVASIAGFRQSTRLSTDPPLPAHGKMGEDLFLAVGHGDLPLVESLLKNGADPNARNGLEFTPLYIAAASHQTEAMRTLLAAGASDSTLTTYGTPLSFAAMGGNEDGVKLLLSRKVDPDVRRTDGMTPLILAANIGATPIIADLIASKVNVNAQDDAGETALAEAARGGFVSASEALIAAGADVNLADTLGETPLMLAAMNGHADMVRLLLRHGAHPNATDASGCSAMLLCASSGDYPDVIQALRDGGANARVTDGEGRRASSVAALHGYSETARKLSGTYRPVPASSTPRVAVTRGLALIQSAIGMFGTEAKCVSCHQDGLGRIATGEAAAHGFRMDQSVQRMETARVGGMVNAMLPLHRQVLRDPEAVKQLPLMEINEVSDTYGWLLAGMAAQDQPKTEASQAMAMCLARQQSADGSWTFSVPRVPMQSSFFTFTALAVHALETYGPATHRAELVQRVAHAREWLLKGHPQDSEDRAARLLGLRWSGADAGSRRKAVAQILADQRPDGGWSQLPGGHSDAYATGQALYALRVGGGVSVSTPAWQHGKRYLLRTQQKDGSWFVNKRAIPANNYFSSGFPYGESQYASFNGTCWAVLALLQAHA